MKFTYLIIDLCTIAVPLLFSFHKKIRFDRELKFFIPASVVAAACFIAWDRQFTLRGIWGFNDRYLTDVQLFGLPVEEILFFFCIPYACVFTYHSLKPSLLKITKGRSGGLTAAILIGLLAGGFFYRQRAYTAVTSVSTAVLLVAAWCRLFPVRLSVCYIVWLGLILPFFFVNGLLTGTGLGAPVVFYNDAENTGIRLLTIPIEDFIYGFSLFLLNVCMYEWLASRFRTARLQNSPVAGVATRHV